MGGHFWRCTRYRYYCISHVVKISFLCLNSKSPTYLVPRWHLIDLEKGYVWRSRGTEERREEKGKTERNINRLPSACMTTCYQVLYYISSMYKLIKPLEPWFSMSAVGPWLHTQLPEIRQANLSPKILLLTLYYNNHFWAGCFHSQLSHPDLAVHPCVSDMLGKNLLCWACQQGFPISLLMKISKQKHALYFNEKGIN